MSGRCSARAGAAARRPPQPPPPPRRADPASVASAASARIPAVAAAAAAAAAGLARRRRVATETAAGVEHRHAGGGGGGGGGGGEEIRGEIDGRRGRSGAGACGARPKDAAAAGRGGREIGAGQRVSKFAPLRLAAACWLHSLPAAAARRERRDGASGESERY